MNLLSQLGQRVMDVCSPGHHCGGLWQLMQHGPCFSYLLVLWFQQMFLNEVPGDRTHELDSDPVFQLRRGYFL